MCLHCKGTGVMNVRFSVTYALESGKWNFWSSLNGVTAICGNLYSYEKLYHWKCNKYEMNETKVIRSQKYVASIVWTNYAYTNCK